MTTRIVVFHVNDDGKLSILEFGFLSFIFQRRDLNMRNVGLQILCLFLDDYNGRILVLKFCFPNPLGLDYLFD